MTTTNQKQPLPLDWLLASGAAITEEKLEEIQAAQKYANRERVPEPLLPLADLYNELTAQEPTKQTLSDWVLTFEEWKSEKLEPDHIRTAFQQASDPNKGFHVGRPGALTTTARSAKTKSVKGNALAINQQAIDQTKEAMDKQWNQNYVPKPANLPRPRISTPQKRTK